MSYVAYGGLSTPNDVIGKMYEYVVSRGYNIVEPIKDDLNIYDMSSVDGKKFVFMDRTDTYFIHVRSCNGINIFGISDDATMDITTPDISSDYSGIGLTVSEGYSRTQRWYNQYLVPIKHKAKDVQAVYIPVNDRSSTSVEANSKKYTLYCNNVSSPSDTLIFSVVAENVGSDGHLGHDYRAVHLVVGNLDKYDVWEGGLFFSGSSVPSLMKEAHKFFVPAKSGDSVNDFFDVQDDGILPILSSGNITNTFLRIDIDEAPSDARGNIRWASSGKDNVTGKPLSIPVRVAKGGNGLIPNYSSLQSTGELDWGRNINTLNCITVNFPLYFAVRVDPDAMDNYAGVGQVSGVYYVCLLNMQTCGTYEMSYPKSNDLCQVFSYSMRRGIYGFDGVSIRQNENDI